MSNHTQFILVGFLFSPQKQIFVSVALILIYVVSILGNLLIIVAVCLHQQLQTPMYFLLSNLAALDIFLITSTVPKLLEILVSDSQTISKSHCIMQFYFYISLGVVELCILALMSFDRYVAICHPLQYCTIMTHRFCWRLITASWIFGFLEFIPTVYLITHQKWCQGPDLINHFFCDGSALLSMSCSDKNVAEFMFLGLASFTILGSFIPSVTSYCFILSSIFTMPLIKSRNKTFSTCSSHLVVVLISYGSCIFIYIRKPGTMPTSLEKNIAVLNSILGPCLNPFIYTLRNQMVQKTVRDLCRLSICKLFNISNTRQVAEGNRNVVTEV